MVRYNLEFSTLQVVPLCLQHMYNCQELSFMGWVVHLYRIHLPDFNCHKMVAGIVLLTQYNSNCCITPITRHCISTVRRGSLQDRCFG